MHTNKRTHRLESIESNEDFAYLADPLVLDHYSTSNTFRDLVQSIFTQVHNETINAWSHFLGGLYFAYEAVRTKDQTALQIYCACTSFCFLASGVSHFAMGLGEKTNDLFGRLDYAGISISVWGSATSIAMVVSEKDPSRLSFYLKSLTALSTLSLSSALFGIKSKTMRVGLYVFTALGCLMPLFEHRDDPIVIDFFAYHLKAILACYVVGFAFYFSRFPERSFPGTFDLVFSSHNFWHVSVWLAAWFNYQFLTGAVLKIQSGLDP